MISVLPKLRSDLTVQRQEAGGEAHFVVKDPATGEFYRLRETEHFILTQLDGETPLEDVRRRTEREFGGELPQDMFNGFVERLERTGLLEGGDTSKRIREKQGRIRGSLFYLRIKLLDPSRILDRFVRVFRFLFTRQFVVASGCMILLAAWTLFLNWSEFTDDISRMYQLSSIPLFLAVMFVVVSMHEFGHGLTCKHFGGDVREMGFMLIYFQPALYCNVSDVWLFREKWKRLLVGFAGPYFELFVWSLAVIVWRVTYAEAWIHDLALIVVAGSGVKTLLNFNPFIKLDGYYLLSDYLEIPNLRKKSFRYVGGLIERLFGIDSSQTIDGTPRERRIFALYGVIAGIGTLSLLTYIFMLGGKQLIEGGAPIVFLLTFGLVGVRLRRKFRRFFGKGGLDLSDDDDDEPRQHDSPNKSVQPRKEEHPSARRRVFVVNESGVVEVLNKKAHGRRWKKMGRSLKVWTKWIGLPVGAVLLLFLIPMELRVSGSFTILPVHNADVRAEIEGLMKDVFVTEGDVVREGDLIARLSDSEVRSEFEKTRAEIQQSQAKLRMQEIGPAREEVGLARTSVEKARERLKYARARAERNKALFEKGLIAKVELENTQELADVAENDLAEAKSRLDVLLRGPRKEEIEATRAELMRLEAQRSFLEDQLGRMEVRSPVSGVVATPARQLREMVNQVVQKGALIAKVLDFRKLTVEIVVPENEIADVKVDQYVAVKARAYPDETFDGVVTAIATTAASGGSLQPQSMTSGTASPAARTFLVTSEIKNGSLLLKPGMTGQAKVSCGERSAFALIMRRLARTVKVEFWSWW